MRIQKIELGDIDLDCMESMDSDYNDDGAIEITLNENNEEYKFTICKKHAYELVDKLMEVLNRD